MWTRAEGARGSGRNGFTLIEILLAISIITIMVSVGGVLLSGVKAQRALEKRMSGIEVLARVAHTAVLREQTPWMVVFEETRIYVGPASDNPHAFLEEDGSGVQAVRTIELDDDEDVFLKRTGWNEWLRVEKPELWRFEPRALLEPLEIRIQSDNGWIQGQFDPLTARLDDVMMEAK